MSRTVKFLKDKDGNELEVYSSNCILCKKEMVFPKSKADELEALVPFLKAKIEAGTPCVECTRESMKNGTFSFFTPEEIEMLKVVADKERKKFEEEQKKK